ncbi:RNA polymerase sigma-70 factor (ECF subfamily) [Nitrobacteraceae bacterium AZCC 1564]
MVWQHSISDFRGPCAGSGVFPPAKRPSRVTQARARHRIARASRTGSHAQVSDQVSYQATDLVSDDDLIRRIAGRDAAAMHILYERYRAKAFNYIHRLVRERQDVEDIVSQTFLDVWHAADTFECRSSVSTWLLAIARFKALHHFRQRTRARIDDVEIPERIDDAESPEATIDRTKMNDVLRLCVHKLHPAQRKVVDLVYYQERSVIEASEILGIPCATVKTRMFYARKELASLLESAGLDRATCEFRQRRASSAPRISSSL